MSRLRTAARAGLACLLLQTAAQADEPAPRFAGGAATFQDNCAVCHGEKGLGNPALAPPLTAYPATYAASPAGRRQLALTVLNGMFGGIDVQGHHFDFKMPEFTQLEDAQLAEVLNFVVFDIGHAPGSVAPLQPAEIAAERAHPLDGSAVRAERSKLLTALGL